MQQRDGGTRCVKVQGLYGSGLKLKGLKRPGRGFSDGEINHFHLPIVPVRIKRIREPLLGFDTMYRIHKTHAIYLVVRERASHPPLCQGD